MVAARLASTLIVTGMLLARTPLTAWSGADTIPAAGDASPVVSVTGAPPGTEALGAQWAAITVAGLGVMRAAVLRPSGAGPFPTLVLLHGSHGFAREYVRLAQELANGGVLAIAACWFRGGGGAGSSFITRIDCPEAPSMPAAASPEARLTVDALVRAARGFTLARADRIALFGHSRGGAAALAYVLDGGDVQAAILSSAGYPDAFAERVSRLGPPVLMLHGTADSPADGGAAVTNVEMARRFEAAGRAAGKPVDAVYYDGGRHNGIFSDPTQHRDEVDRMLAFLRRALR